MVNQDSCPRLLIRLTLKLHSKKHTDDVRNIQIIHLVGYVERWYNWCGKWA